MQEGESPRVVQTILDDLYSSLTVVPLVYMSLLHAALRGLNVKADDVEIINGTGPGGPFLRVLVGAEIIGDVRFQAAHGESAGFCMSTYLFLPPESVRAIEGFGAIDVKL